MVVTLHSMTSDEKPEGQDPSRTEVFRVSGVMYGVEVPLAPEVAAVRTAIEDVLWQYRRSPILLLRKEWREGLAVQCASAALFALGRDPLLGLDPSDEEM